MRDKLILIQSNLISADIPSNKWLHYINKYLSDKGEKPCSEMFWFEVALSKSCYMLSQKQQELLFECQSKKEDVTADKRFTHQNYQQVFIVDSSVQNLLYEVEVLLASVLFNAITLTDKICDLTTDLNKLSNGALWNSEIKKNDQDRSTTARMLVKSYGKYSKQLARLASWRDKRAHEKHFYAFIEGEPWRFTYSEEQDWKLLGTGREFTIDDLKESIKALNDFCQWWFEQSKTQIDACKLKQNHNVMV